MKEYISFILLVIIILSGSCKQRIVNKTGADENQCTDHTVISQHGITWTFDKEYEYGQFINGDYWVVGPVTITDINPDFAPVEPGSPEYGNGTVIDPVPRLQGYDTRAYDYNENQTEQVPFTVAGISSIVSTISIPDANRSPYLSTAAVLTVLESTPPENSFRPPYIAGPKPLIQWTQDIPDRLPRYQKPEDGIMVRQGTRPYEAYRHLPDINEVASWFQRVWLDHLEAEGGLYRSIRPENNLPDYSRDSTQLMSIAGCRVLASIGEDVNSILINLIQVGIDYNYVALQDPELWPASEGQGNGRKWPVVFAGILLDNQEMINNSFWVSEEQHTYYSDDILLPIQDPWGFNKRDVPAWTEGNAQVLWGSLRFRNDTNCRDFEHVSPEYWDQVHPGANVDACTGERYRRCCTSYTWVGQALSMHLIDGMQYWTAAWSDYVDRWMTEGYTADEILILQNAPCNPDRINLVDYPESADQRSSVSNFVDAMWHTYRAPLDTFCGDNVCTDPVENEITCPGDCP